jgi:hypothetical protein
VLGVDVCPEGRLDARELVETSEEEIAETARWFQERRGLLSVVRQQGTNGLR